MTDQVSNILNARGSGASEASAVDLGRALNAITAGLLIVFIAPLLAVLALLVRAQDGGPAIFRQERIGRNGRIFRCLKFRSMAVDAELRLQRLLAADPEARAEWAAQHKLKSDPRITRLGDFMRKTSLDELPQLFNVLVGDMELVGPRPVVQAEAARYGRRFRNYCTVRPGITGLWQVSGRSNTTYRRRVAMDVVYSRAKSPSLDLRILLATIPAVLLRKGSC